MSFFTVISLIGLMLVAEPKQPNYAAGRTDDNQNCYVNIEPSGLITLGQKHGTNQAQGKEGECVFRANVVKDQWDKALIGFTILFSAGLVWIGFRQVVWMRKTQESTHDSAEAAKASAEAAIKSAEAAENAALVDRPALLITEVHLQSLAAWDSRRLAGSIIADNFGKSPAIIIKATAKIMIVDKRPHVSSLIDGNEAYPFNRIVKSGGYSQCSYGETEPERLSDELKSLVFEGKKQIIFYGCIYYEDIFHRKFESHFFGTYKPPKLSEDERTIRGPDEYNKCT